MNYARLKADALFVISVGHAWALPKGTTIQVLQNAPSCVTGTESELHVQAPDAGGRPWRGWIARSTPLEALSDTAGAASKTVWKTTVTHFALPAIDALREAVVLTLPRGGHNKRGQATDPWTFFDWLCVHGVEKRAKLEATLKQFRKAIPKDGTELIQKVVKVVLDEDVSTGRISKNRARLNSDAALLKALRDAERQLKENATMKRTSKKAEKVARQSAPRTNSMSKTVGESLLALKIPALRPYANKLVKGDTSRKDLVALRDVINAAAGKARERGKKSLASQLSSQNRLVRRLERASR